jgi:hypothetical protein
MHILATTLTLATFAAALPAQSDSGRVAAMVGCYRLHIDAPTQQDPQLFRLDAGRPLERLPMLRQMNEGLGRVLHDRPPPPFDTATAFGNWRRVIPDHWLPGVDQLWSTAWQINGDSLQINWSSGFEVIDFSLLIAPDTLRGTSHSRGDQVGTGSTIGASAWRTSCPRGMTGDS